MTFVAYSDAIPPSDNKLKTPVQGRLILTSAARRYKSALYEDLKLVPAVRFGRNAALSFLISLDMPNIETQGFAKGKAKYRFFKRDVSNLIQIVENVVCTYLEIDDSQFMEVTIRKRKFEKEGLWIQVKEIPWT